jgi:hypothetical protein
MVMYVLSVSQINLYLLFSDEYLSKIEGVEFKKFLDRMEFRKIDSNV